MNTFAKEGLLGELLSSLRCQKVDQPTINALSSVIHNEIDNAFSPNMTTKG